MCCTNSWVRKFSSENGGGHAFSRAKFQNIDMGMFKHMSWNDDADIIAGASDGAFECDPDNFTNASCEIKSLSPLEEETYLNWAASLELIGIPQVAIKTNDEIFKLVGDNQRSFTNGGSNLITAKDPLTINNDAPPTKQILLDVNTQTPDFIDSTGHRLYSAASYDKLNMTIAGTKNNLKKVFSENEFGCCIPTGKEVPDTTTATQCCTGFLANIGTRRCCLPDFTDVTLYLNRYVSSEGRGLPDSAYDATTGYIKDPGQVRLLAGQKNICCSGNVMTGFAISQLPIPLTGGTYRQPPDALNTSRRFSYLPESPIDDNPETLNAARRFKEGIRWNNHLYCVPQGFGQ
jgi:hypothetical protein